MILDGHIHIESEKVEPDCLTNRLKLANVSGGIIISLPPQSFTFNGKAGTPEERITNLMEWIQTDMRLYPFYWLDPTEDDAERQIDLAIEKGVAGFKVICSHFYPSDKRAMKTFKIIAERNKPLLFHSGILWGGSKFSSIYNRPVEFEALSDINGLRFSLAHISWPWCDELIAVYGKFQSLFSYDSDFLTEMFVDTTPGTPEIYRKDALTKLFTVGYDIEENIIFGSDCQANDYNVDWVAKWIETDKRIMRDIGINDEIIANVQGNNLIRFVEGRGRKSKKTLKPAELN